MPAMLRRLTALFAGPTLLACAVLPTAAHAACPNANQTPKSTAKARSATLCLVNEQRRRHHLAPLRTQSRLQQAATSYSLTMVRHRFFDHVGPDGSTLTSRINLAGYGGWMAIGENLAWGSGRLATPATIVDEWMHSPGHRANILGSAFRQIGIGIAHGAPQPGVGGVAAVYTTDFARPR
jgi:uncharacterized protein YkwD